jgi:hypothetical protein
MEVPHEAQPTLVGSVEKKMRSTAPGSVIGLGSLNQIDLSWGFMERGLLWLPLLAVFIGLAWSGWNEYQKVEAYRLWAQDFEQAKYDILSVVGVQGQQVTIAKPTRRGLVDLQQFSLDEIAAIRLLVDGQPVDSDPIPDRGQVMVELIGVDRETCFRVPFTELDLALKWTHYLQKKLLPD